MGYFVLGEPFCHRSGLLSNWAGLGQGQPSPHWSSVALAANHLALAGCILARDDPAGFFEHSSSTDSSAFSFLT